MSLQPSPYMPPRWLRNAHVQSLLGSSPLRVRLGAKQLAASAAEHQTHVLQLHDGTRLQGVHSLPPGESPKAMALLLHGWEGSAESSYMRLSAAALLKRNVAVFRLNFRDHGDTYHLNNELFHSCRLDEVIAAAIQVQQRFAHGVPMFAAGYSLGGNFTLRLALHGAARGLRLQRVAAVCPVISPANTMDALEQGWPVYLHYFERKWGASLRRKFALFPSDDFNADTRKLRMRALTDWLVRQHSSFASLQDYFDGYSVAGERLRSLSVPADILMAADDPVIPVADFAQLQLPTHSSVELAQHGGHCAFLCNARLHGYAEQWLADRLLRQS